MGELLRLAMAVPLAIFYAIHERLTRDEFDEFIAEQRQRLIDLAEGT